MTEVLAAIAVAMAAIGSWALAKAVLGKHRREWP